MTWIIVAIVLFIAAYTFLTLHYRRPGHAYEPYADMKRRANTGRLLAAGYRRVELTTIRPADTPPKANTAMPAPGGLPGELARTVVSVPRLPQEIVDAHAAGHARAGDPYVVEFRCVAPDHHQQLGGAELYIRGDEIVITPDFEPLGSGLEARTRENYISVTIPGGTFNPGSYHVTLVGQRQSRAWLLRVQ
jgi:hypothetical protein